MILQEGGDTKTGKKKRLKRRSRGGGGGLGAENAERGQRGGLAGKGDQRDLRVLTSSSLTGELPAASMRVLNGMVRPWKTRESGLDEWSRKLGDKRSAACMTKKLIPLSVLEEKEGKVDFVRQRALARKGEGREGGSLPASRGTKGEGGRGGSSLKS